MSSRSTPSPTPGTRANPLVTRWHRRRAALWADERPGLVRVLDPTTLRVIRLIDPITRTVVKGDERRHTARCPQRQALAAMQEG